MHAKLQHLQWLFLDPSVVLNENDTDREARRLTAEAFARRGRPLELERVERAWMQAIASPRPVHPLAGAISVLAPDPSTASAVLAEVTRNLRNQDMLFSGMQMVLGALQREVKVGIIGPYRLPGARTQFDRFRLSFPVVALSDEQQLSHKLDLNGRPDPALFTWALRKAGCPASLAAFASDRVDLGLAPAKVAGMTTIWVRVTNYKMRYPRNAAETPDMTVTALNELL